MMNKSQYSKQQSVKIAAPPSMPPGQKTLPNGKFLNNTLFFNFFKFVFRKGFPPEILILLWFIESPYQSTEPVKWVDRSFSILVYCKNALSIDKIFQILNGIGIVFETERIIKLKV